LCIVLFILILKLNIGFNLNQQNYNIKYLIVITNKCSQILFIDIYAFNI